jgi:hypothetical protein
MLREFLTVAEVADELGLKPKTVRSRMYDGTWRRARTLVLAAGHQPTVPLVGDRPLARNGGHSTGSPARIWPRHPTTPDWSAAAR